MTMTTHIADTISCHFQRRWVQGYVRGKLKIDPIYPAALRYLVNSPLPLLDLGCGLGLLAFYLRENGCRQPVMAIDSDTRKIAAAGRAAQAGRYGDIQFVAADARQKRPFTGNVALLDVLHYFRPEDQSRLLKTAADYLPPGGILLIRSVVEDGSWRAWLTRLEESFARSVRWMKSETLSLPTWDFVLQHFPETVFLREVEPLWGKTPFNGYLFVLRRKSQASACPHGDQSLATK